MRKKIMAILLVIAFAVQSLGLVSVMTVQATDIDDDTEYREDVFKVTNMRFLDANGNETTEYVEGDTARLEVTLANNSDSDLELIENGMRLKLYSGDIYDYDGGEIQIGQGETKKVIVTKKITKAEAEEFRTIGIYSAEISVRVGGMPRYFRIEQDTPTVGDYYGTHTKLSFDLSKIQAKVWTKTELDKDAPHLQSIEVPDAIDAPQTVYFTIGIDQATLGGAAFSKVKMEIADTRHPKNVLTLEEQVTAEENGKYTVPFRADIMTVDSIYKIKTIILIDENKNERTYRVFEDGKLGISVNGESGENGTIANPDIVITNDRNPSADFDAPVLKNIKFAAEYPQKENDIDTWLDVEYQAEDESGIRYLDVEVTDGGHTYILHEQNRKQVDDHTYQVRYYLNEALINYRYDKIHGKFTVNKLYLYDESDRENVSVYSYDAVKKAFCLEKEQIAAQGTVNYDVHTWKWTIRQATPSSNGQLIKQCTECDYKEVAKVIPRPKTVELTQTEFEYDGKEHIPDVWDVLDSEGNSISSENYYVIRPDSSMEPGEYKLIIRFKGDYYAESFEATYRIRPERTPIVLQSFYFDQSKLDSEGKLTVNVTLDAQYEVTNKQMRLFVSEINDRATLEPVSKMRYGDAYSFVFDASKLPKGEYRFDEFAFYDDVGNTDGKEYSYTTVGDGIGFYNGDNNIECAISQEQWDLWFCRHEYQQRIDYKASFNDADGLVRTTCKYCRIDIQEKEQIIPSIAKVTPKVSSYIYDGKVKTPGVTAKDRTDKTISASNYRIGYASGRKNVGRYSMTVKFVGSYYEGSTKKTFDSLPKGTSVSSAKAAKKAMTVKWKKQASQTSGYQLQYSQKSNFKSGNKTVTVSKNSTTSSKITKLTPKKTCYIRIRTYKTVKYGGKSVKLYSAWSKAAKAKIK